MLDNRTLAAYAQPIHNKRVRVELLDFNFAVIDSIEGVCVGGSLQKVADEPLRRSGNITLCVPIDRSATTFLDAVGGYTISFGGKIWIDKYVKISIGVDTLNAPSPINWQSFGICLIDEPVRDFSAEQYQISFSVIDLMARLTGLRYGQLTAISTMIEANEQSGSTYTQTETRAALTSVITELAGIQRYAIYPLPQKYKYLPYDIKVEVGATVWDLISQFMGILAGWQIYFDDDGVLRVEPIPSGVHEMTYPLKYKNLISAKVSTDFQGVKNQIIVYGRMIEPSFIDTTGSTGNPLLVSLPSANAQDFIIGATTIAFYFPVETKLLQKTTFSLTDANGTYTCNIVGFNESTPYLPEEQLIQDSYYCMRLYSATLTSGGKVVPSSMTWEWIGKQQISACKVDDNRESPFYINNQLPNSYWCGMCSPVNPIALDEYNMYIDDQNAPISALTDGMILTFMITATSSAGMKINVYSSASSAAIATQVPIYDNGSPIAYAKMYSDYTIFVVKYDASNNQFDFLGRHPYALTRVLSGGVYDNIFADLLAEERAEYELFLASSMQNNIDLSVVPNFALDVNVKIPFSESWVMPPDFAQSTQEPEKGYIVKSVTYPLDVGGTAQEIQAVQIYDENNFIGKDYEIPTDQAPRLSTPTIYISGVTLTISGAEGATSFDVIAQGTPTVNFTTTDRTVQLSNYLQPGATYLIGVIAKANGYKNSSNSNLISYTFAPSKGDIITLNLDGAEKQYRVLKRNGLIAEVMGLFIQPTVYNSSSRVADFSDGTQAQSYDSSKIDTYLNTTWYDTFSATAKAAIVDKNIIQDCWVFGTGGDPDYAAAYGEPPTTYKISKKAGTLTIGDRHVYTLSIQDIIDYLGATPQMTESDTTLIKQNIVDMFGEVSSNSRKPWLMSANGNTKTYVWYVDTETGRLFYVYSSSSSNGAVPVCQVDLSKIEWNYAS